MPKRPEEYEVMIGEKVELARKLLERWKNIQSRYLNLGITFDMDVTPLYNLSCSRVCELLAELGKGNSGYLHNFSFMFDSDTNDPLPKRSGKDFQDISQALTTFESIMREMEADINSRISGRARST